MTISRIVLLHEMVIYLGNVLPFIFTCHRPTIPVHFSPFLLSSCLPFMPNTLKLPLPSPLVQRFFTFICISPFLFLTLFSFLLEAHTSLAISNSVWFLWLHFDLHFPVLFLGDLRSDPVGPSLVAAGYLHLFFPASLFSPSLSIFYVYLLLGFFFPSWPAQRSSGTLTSAGWRSAPTTTGSTCGQRLAASQSSFPLKVNLSGKRPTYSKVANLAAILCNDAFRSFI